MIMYTELEEQEAGNEGRSTAFLTADNSRIAPELWRSQSSRNKKSLFGSINQLLKKIRIVSKLEREERENHLIRIMMMIHLIQCHIIKEEEEEGEGGYQKFSHSGGQSFDSDEDSGTRVEEGEEEAEDK